MAYDDEEYQPVEPLERTAKWMRELPQSQQQVKLYSYGDVASLMDGKADVEIIKNAFVQYKRVRLHNPTIPVPAATAEMVWGLIDMRLYRSYVISLQGVGTEYVDYIIEATINPEYPLLKGSDEYTTVARKGWRILRPETSLGTSWNDGNYNKNPQNYHVYPSNQFRWGTEQGSPAAPWGDEFMTAKLPWAFIRVGFRLNSGSGTGGKVLAYAGCRS